jgi:putative SOS response-associated peptidase YedK
MCGRFARFSLSRELERYFNAHPAAFEIQPNFNVTPTQKIPVIIQQEGVRHSQEKSERLFTLPAPP